ncbi:sugar phosphate isomerase/epimerase [Pseudomonas sp. SLFW]|uniref:sugar phosphate isomerase/epimerase family protein n=1 Tax=Pseudomonas sp. SLFW TaxID=2683259 RepID=UPI001411B957|nr:sugar phosphate isomerase/epimerase [Pseudomonas sp. SLFW]NBB12735.1 sugar phosphate isomerase/epimerase [Pseudomonas sp. SLFW]
MPELPLTREFVVFQSMWAMQNEQGVLPLPLEQQLTKIAEAGFDGITDHFYEPAAARELSRLARSLGLQIEGQLFPQTVDGLQPGLDIASQYGCHHLTIQADIRPRTLKEAVTLIEGWQRLAEQVDFPVLIETHRYRVTNDLHFTLDLLRELPEMKLLADLSHYVVGREIPLPPSDEDQRQIETILRRSWGFHGRVASCEQVQVPISLPQHQPWLSLFSEWWRFGIHDWLARPEAQGSLSFTCELGPPPYGITDRFGRDITDRWEESLQMKGLAHRLWQDCAPI